MKIWPFKPRVSKARKLEPIGARFPETWVTLLFTLKDPETGRYRNAIEHFDSELEAGAFLERCRPELLDGFKGAYKEIPGFLAELNIPDRYKAPFGGPSMPSDLTALEPLEETPRHAKLRDGPAPLKATAAEVVDAALEAGEELEEAVMGPTLEGEARRHREDLEELPFQAVTVPEGTPTVEALERLQEQQELQGPPFIVLTLAEPGGTPNFGGGFSALPGASQAAAYLTDTLPVAATVYRREIFHPQEEK